MLQLRTRSAFDTLFNEMLSDFYTSFYHDESGDGVTVYTKPNEQRTFKNGVLHSVNGKPAVTKYNSKREVIEEQYFWEGEKVTKETVLAKVAEVEDNKKHVITLGNKEYVVTGKKLKEIEKMLGLT